QGGPEFGGDYHGQRRLAQPGLAGQQDVIRCAAALLGPLDHQLQLLTHPRLTDEFAQGAWAQAAVDVTLADRQRGRDVAVGEVALEVFGHRALPSSDNAARSAPGVGEM